MVSARQTRIQSKGSRSRAGSAGSVYNDCAAWRIYAAWMAAEHARMRLARPDRRV